MNVHQENQVTKGYKLSGGQQARGYESSSKFKQIPEYMFSFTG